VRLKQHTEKAAQDKQLKKHARKAADAASVVWHRAAKEGTGAARNKDTSKQIGRIAYELAEVGRRVAETKPRRRAGVRGAIAVTALGAAGVVGVRKLREQKPDLVSFGGPVTIQESVDVEVPLSTAYNQWTQFEQFPNFMEGIDEVRQLDDTRLHWVANVRGRRREWDAKITEQRPDERVAWTSTSGTLNAGVVTFHRLSDTSTRIMVQIDYEPADTLEAAAGLAGAVRRRVRRDLERFKEMIESRGRETGAWRGTVESGATQSAPGDQR
jgi:uncharacterized membrane protein